MSDNIDKSIQHIMDNPPEYGFEERLWADLENRLDNDPPKRTGGISWIPILSFLFLTLCSTGFFAYKYYTTDYQFTLLQEQYQLEKNTWKTQKNNAVQNITILDTVYKEILISKTIENTIPAAFVSNTNRYPNDFYHWNISPKDIYRHQEFFDKFNYFSSSSFLNSTDLTKNNIPSVAEKKVNNLASVIEDKEQEDFIDSDHVISNLLVLPIHSLPINENELTVKDQAPLLNVDYFPKRRRSLNSYLYPLRPKTISINALGGIARSLNIEGSRGNINGKMGLEIGYGNNFGFLVGVEYITNSFEYYLEAEERSNPEGLTPIPAKNDGDLLNEIYGDFKYVQIPFGIQYYFRDHKRLQPYIGLGLVAHKALKSEMLYEYLSIMEEYSFTENNLLTRDYILSDIWSSVGLRYHLNNKWAFLFQSSTQVTLNNHPLIYQNHQYFKWNVGLQYQF